MDDYRFLVNTAVAMLAIAVVSCLGGEAAGDDAIPRFVDPDKASGTSAAVVVPPNAALAHTGVMLPVNSKNQVVGKGDAAVQADRALSNLNWALAAAGSGREYTIKINVYAADDRSLATARERVAEAFPGPTRPAATWVVNKQPREDVLVTMDAVATAPLREPDRVALFVSDQLPAARGTSHVAVMPPGDVFYISGQVEEGKSLAEGVRHTMAGLHKTLDHFGMTAEHVVQVKAFIHPMAEADIAWEQIAAAYDRQSAPPAVLTEWQASLPRPTEIELIAVNPDPGAAEAEAARYLTPPWMSASPVFSRVAASRSDAHNGWVYFSGITGDPHQSPEKQVAEVFETLKDLCDRTGSDFEHLVKATYYVGDRSVTEALRDVRPGYYNPKRPPAASLIMVRGVGDPDAVYTLDMIGVSVADD